MNYLSIRATAYGSANPPQANFPSTVTNGDFKISGSNQAPLVGNGVDETTTWDFDFKGDPNFTFFSPSQPLLSAKLTLVLIPRSTLITTDFVRIEGLSGITEKIQSLPVHQMSTVVIELCGPHYSQAQIMGALQGGSNGIIPMFYHDDAILVCAELVLKQRLPTYQYAVKAVCGRADGRILAKGIYHTAINIHNPTYERVRFRKKFAEALPGKPGRVSKFIDDRLGSDQALEIDCPEILKYGGRDKFFKGFVIIESDVELDIVAVYTAASISGKSEEVRSVHCERVAPRKRKGKTKINRPGDIVSPSTGEGILTSDDLSG